MNKGDLYQDGQLVLTGVEVHMLTRRDAAGLATRYGTLTMPQTYTVIKPEHELVYNGKRYSIAISGSVYVRTGESVSFFVLGPPIS